MAEKRILIVDDAIFQSEILAEVFGNQFGEKLDVDVAKDFKSVQQLFLNNDYDLILTDYLLGSVGTGVELKEKVDAEIDSDADWVLMSALDVDSLKENHRGAGFKGFVHKSDYAEICQKVGLILFP